MKKFIISLVCALSLTGAMAQSKFDKITESLPPFKLGAQAGFNLSWLSQNGYDGHAGFNFGLTTMFDASQLVKDTYVRGSILVNRKGYDGHPGVAGNVSQTGNAWYLEIPVRYGYGYLLTNDWTLLGETGPYIAIGTGGSIKTTGLPKDDYFDGDTFDRFDFGWGIHLGALYDQHHQVMLGWDWGFIDLDDHRNIKNRNFMISYAYYFL